MMRQLSSLSFTITIEDNKYTDSQKEKVFIADSKSGRVGYNTTYRKENVFTAKVRSLGKYANRYYCSTVSMGKSIEGRWVSTQKQFNSPLMIPAQELRAMTGI
jgi:hypothetical protein